MKIIFAGTPEFAIKPLTVLVGEHDVVAVFTQPDRRAGRGKRLTASPVKLLALEQDIPVFQPTKLLGQESLIKELGADLMVVVAYGMLLPQNILDIPPFGCINIHASILPRWRGAAPIQRAIEAGDALTGVSIMKMELGLDTGPVYKSYTTPITAQDTSSTLEDKLADLGAQGIRSTLIELQARSLSAPIPQNDSQATYAKKITKQEAAIDWSISAQRIQARIRAFNPWPICQTQHQQTRIRLWQASVTDLARGQKAAGTIINISQEGVVVACGRGHIRLEVLQRDGSRPMPSKEFCNGYKLQVGDVFAQA